MKIKLAKPRGFCAGVDRAIEMVELALEQIGPPIYVRHEVVHNQYVVEDLKNRGAIFTDYIDNIPEGSHVIFSAHGVSQAVRQRAQARNLKILDATCPLVTKVHVEVAKYSKQGQECILVGHSGHPEVEGTMGQYHNPNGGIYLVQNVEDARTVEVKRPDQVGVVTQTTLSVDDTAEILEVLKQRFPQMQTPKKEDICYATTNRQEAVKNIANEVDDFVVVGSVASSNSNRLKELAQRYGCRAYLVDRAEDMQRHWFNYSRAVGVTAGASAPEHLVQQVIAQLKQWGGQQVEEAQGKEETVTFPVPRALRQNQMEPVDSTSTD